jgi:hypothetical protein
MCVALECSDSAGRKGGPTEATDPLATCRRAPRDVCRPTTEQGGRVGCRALLVLTKDWRENFETAMLLIIGTLFSVVVELVIRTRSRPAALLDDAPRGRP